MPEASALAVRKTITVNVPIEKAFAVFTDGIGGWWPTKTHSINGEKTDAVSMETRAGGRLYETDEDGADHDWGVITTWDPPHRVAFTWEVRRGVETQQQVDVTFTSEGSGTRVELVHTGWEKLGDEGMKSMKDYDNGWNGVLDLFVTAANA